MTSLLLLSGAVAAQAISFLYPSTAYNSGSSRATSICNTCVAAADFNGDGKPDIAYAVSEFTPFAGVVLGNGDGTFRPGVSFPVNQSDGRPIAGDFNGDGKPDILISGPRTWLYLGHGDGTFSAPLEIGVCANAGSRNPGVVVAADFNRDRKTDLICSAQVLLSNGDGSFRNAGPLDGDAILAADFNGDGNPDLLVANASDKTLALALGHGDGTFGSRSPILLANSPAILAGDFNGDGRTDLVTASVDGTKILVLPGLGDGAFGNLIATDGVPGPITAAADFNGDGKLDLVAGDAILPGNGDGTFGFPVFVGVAIQACGLAASPIASFFPCSSTHVATAIADFNGDGLPDIAAGSLVQGPQNAAVASISVLLNDSPGDGFAVTGVSSSALTYPVGPGSIVSAFGVDLAPSTAASTLNPPPTTLGGIRLHVRDRSHAADTLAPLLYVSPVQINYILPSSDPFAWVSIERVGSPYIAKGMSVPISPIAPGLYTAGSGLAAASAVSIARDGTQTPLNVAVPIDLSGPPVYLSLYGTGFAQASAASTSCQIAGETLPAAYAGPQMRIPGLDQINLLLPASLAGTGDSSVACSFRLGQAVVVSNSVRLTIR